jgi:two-component system, OmpR family, sensor histidine kinase MtrB
MSDTATPHPEPLRRGVALGIRARIALAVALVTLLLSAVLSITTLTITGQTLLTTREESVTLRALANAQTIDGGLSSGGAAADDVQTLLSSLPDAGKPSVIIDGADGRPVTSSLDPRFGVETLPAELRERVIDGAESGLMRFRDGGEPLLVVGVPLPDRGAAYFEVSPLGDIDDGLRTLGITLVVATLVTTLAGGALGYWASRYTLRPITRIGQATEAVALGQLDTRIDEEDYVHDADLAPLVANFNAMVSALQDRIDRDARFASDVSHELRSPMTTLNAGIQVLANNREDMPERAQTALDLLSADVARFTVLVEDLLEISRFDAGAVRLELDEVALVPLVEQTVTTLTSGAVPVESDPELADTVIACDKRRLLRILANYLNNADKYADGATSVALELHEYEAEPDMGIDEPERTVRIAVEDAGPGVPASERQRIFDRFNRGDQGGARGSDIGVGLGLALAAEHARLQGGSVWVEDRHDGGQGSRFVVELPLLEPLDEASPEGDLSAATPEATSALTLTGEHSAIGVGADGDPLGSGSTS